MLAQLQPPGNGLVLLFWLLEMSGDLRLDEDVLAVVGMRPDELEGVRPVLGLDGAGLPLGDLPCVLFHPRRDL